MENLRKRASSCEKHKPRAAVVRGKPLKTTRGIVTDADQKGSERRMHMGTRRHQKPDRSKAKRREFAKKIGNVAKKTGKFFGALIVGGLITSLPLPVNGQDSDSPKALANKPSDKQTEIMVAAKGNELPENTVALGALPKDAGPKADSLTHDPTKAKPKVEPGPKPNAPTIIGEKFCEVNTKGTILGFQKLDIGKDKVNFELNVEKYLTQIGATSLEDVRAKAYGKRASGTRSVTLIFDNGIICFFILKDSTVQITPAITKTPDNNPILRDNIVLFGADVAAISVSGLVTTDGISHTFTELFGWSQPILSGAKLHVDDGGNITITALNIKTKEGKPGKYYIPLDGAPSIQEDNEIITWNE